MSGWSELGVPAERLIPPGRGAPAPCVPEFAWAAYESENRVQYVMECVVAMIRAPVVIVVDQPSRFSDRYALIDLGSELYFPVSYWQTTALAPSGLTALHHDPEAVWTWRPRVLEIHRDGRLTSLSSQQELEWRIALSQQTAAVEEDSKMIVSTIRWLSRESGYDGWAQLAAFEAMVRQLASFRLHGDDTTLRLPYRDANERACALLMEMLTPQQRIELDVRGGFLVRGTINRCYEVRPDDGCYIVDPETLVRRVSLCVHPDEWIPGCDVALAFKLAVEGGVDGEEEMLRAAKATPFHMRQKPTREQRVAWELEKPMLPVKIIVEKEEADADKDQDAVGLGV